MALREWYFPSMGAFFHELYLSLGNMSTRKAFCGRLEFLLGTGVIFFSPVPISLQYLLSFSVEQYFFHGDKGIAFRLQGIHHLQRRRYGSGVVVVH